MNTREAMSEAIAVLDAPGSQGVGRTMYLKTRWTKVEEPSRSQGGSYKGQAVKIPVSGCSGRCSPFGRVGKPKCLDRCCLLDNGHSCCDDKRPDTL